MSTEGKKQFENIFKPIKIGPVELKNRIVLAPMNETLSGVNGEVTEPMLAYFAARAKGGTALVTTGAIIGTKLASAICMGQKPSSFPHGTCAGVGISYRSDPLFWRKGVCPDDDRVRKTGAFIRSS